MHSWLRCQSVDCKRSGSDLTGKTVVFTKNNSKIRRLIYSVA